MHPTNPHPYQLAANCAIVFPDGVELLPFILGGYGADSFAKIKLEKASEIVVALNERQALRERVERLEDALRGLLHGSRKVTSQGDWFAEREEASAAARAALAKPESEVKG